MARITPLDKSDTDIKPESRAAIEEIQSAHGRVTNMKRTLARLAGCAPRLDDLVRLAR